MEDTKLEFALTSNCMQHGWAAQYYFYCCPNEISENPIVDYSRLLKPGTIFAYHNDAPRLITMESAIINDSSSILVMSEREGDWCERDGFFPWLICEIRFENRFFIHYKVDEFFEKDEADHVFCNKQGSMQSAT